jgi:cytochrome c peroxidase
MEDLLREGMIMFINEFHKKQTVCSVFVAFFTLLGVTSAWADTPLTNEPISPLPTVDSLNLDKGKVKLGERLFKDTRFSKDNSTSCSSCHQIEKGGADGLKRSKGVNGQEGNINAPSVLNSGLNFKQFWNGRSASLEEQADAVVHNPKELDMSWPPLIQTFSSDTELKALFDANYPSGITADNIKNALATYERSLLTPSRFDYYLQGKTGAINESERKGYQLFKDYGCVACHQGTNVGGNMFQKFGAMDDYFGKRGNITDADMGRYAVTKKEEDKYVFKVPSLRNVALTAPYFHDGTAETLDAAVDVMFRHQLGRTGTDEDKKLIVAFLQTLTGENMEVKP